MTWTLQNIDNYMKALASEARALKRKGWTEDDVHEFVARAAHVAYRRTRNRCTTL